MLLTSSAWRSSSGRTYSLLRTTSVARRNYLSSPGRVFEETDVVLLRSTAKPSADPILTKPLSSDQQIQTHRGVIRHSDVIGKRVRDIVLSNKGAAYRIQEVPLGDYTRFSKRLVTPIYPADANLIVSLFDIHVTPPSPDDGPSALNAPKLEILEAGTGHGALTSHLSRAIHAANPPKPPGIDFLAHKSVTSDTDGNPESSKGTESMTSSPASTFLLGQWKKERRAIIHSIDNRAKVSRHAEKTLRGFRRGLYADNVDFHVDDVSAWVDGELKARQNASGEVTISPFLTHAFLDLPAADQHLRTVASAVHIDGMLVVFTPSITQITECFEKVKTDDISLHLDQVLELGTNGTTGGREWDVRAVIPRAVKLNGESTEDLDSNISSDSGGEGSDEASPSEASDASRNGTDPIDSMPSLAESAADQAREWKFICRPKVGERIMGGGFLGVFRKRRQSHG